MEKKNNNDNDNNNKYEKKADRAVFDVVAARGVRYLYNNIKK